MAFQRRETMIYKMRLNLKSKNFQCIKNLGYTRLTMQKHEKLVIILSSAERQDRPIPLQKRITLNKHNIIISPTREQLEILTSAELNTSGNKKLRSDQSSCKLFWRGVPVNNNRFVVLNSLTISDNWKNQIHH